MGPDKQTTAADKVGLISLVKGGIIGLIDAVIAAIVIGKIKLPAVGPDNMAKLSGGIVGLIFVSRGKENLG